MTGIAHPCCECCGGRKHAIGHPGDPCPRHQRQPRKPRGGARPVETTELPQEPS